MPNLRVETFPLDELHPYHRNPRRGDVDAIAASLEARGQYRPIVVNVGTHASHPFEILAGNHTYLAARQLGWESIEATTVDVDDDRAAQIVLADNRLADLGGYDNLALTNLLESLSGDYAGTGYDADDLAELESAIADATADEWDAAVSNVPDEAEAGYATMSFNLTARQKTIVQDALRAARGDIDRDAGNANGNALAMICEGWLDGRG